MIRIGWTPVDRVALDEPLVRIELPDVGLPTVLTRLPVRRVEFERFVELTLLEAVGRRPVFEERERDVVAELRREVGVREVVAEDRRLDELLRAVRLEDEERERADDDERLELEEVELPLLLARREDCASASNAIPNPNKMASNAANRVRRARGTMGHLPACAPKRNAFRVKLFPHVNYIPEVKCRQAKSCDKTRFSGTLRPLRGHLAASAVSSRRRCRHRFRR